MSLYKNIDYSKLTFETLRNYMSLNNSGTLSILYKFVLACIWPMQLIWNDFETWRIRKQLIANCKWQFGQAQNVLNYIFGTGTDIYFTQVNNDILWTITNDYDYLPDSDPLYDAAKDIFLETNDIESTYFASDNSDIFTILSTVTVNAPLSVDENELRNIVDQIIIDGITYNITLS